MSFINIRKNIIFLLFVIFFSFLYFIFFLYVYLIPNKISLSIVIIIGYFIVIFALFLFINLNHDKDKITLFSYRFLSENSIKLILIIAMCVSWFIAPVSNPRVIINWDRIGYLNYIRAIVFIIGTIFIPGAAIYNILFPKNDLHENFKVESYLLKIALYPLISLSFIGLSVLVMDQVRFERETIGITLFFLILILYVLEVIFKKKRKEKIEFEFKTLKISNYSFIILLMALGIALIALGIHFAMLYLIPGDSWIGLAQTNYIAKSDNSPIEWGRKWSYYPIFWSYISFGLSLLCGLPYFNTNALLALLCYIFPISIYLLIKAILTNLKEIYACFSTILVIIFSGLFYISTDYGHGKAPSFIVDCESLFSYKTMSYLCLFIAIAIFFSSLKTTKDIEISSRIIHLLNESNFQILIALFLLISYILYMIPLLAGFIIIFIYCTISEKRIHNFKLFSIMIFYFNIFFMGLDILMEFYLSDSAYFAIGWFFETLFIFKFTQYIPAYILAYSVLWLFFIILNLIQFRFAKSLIKRYYKLFNNFDFTFVFKIFLIIFTLFLVTELIIINLEEFFLKTRFDNKLIFFYYLDKIFLNIGFIGITGVYLSYYCYKKKKTIFFFLVSWIIVIFLIGSLLIFINSIMSFSFSIRYIKSENFKSMDYWYNRTWIYAVIPLCILSSIGLIKIAKIMRNHPKFKKILSNPNKRNILKFSSLSLIIILTYSNLIMAGMWNGNENNRPTDEEIELFSWMSENISPDSNFLIDNEYIIRVGIFSMVNGRYFFINDYFESDYNQTENIEQIKDLKGDDIEYLLIHEDYLFGSSNRSRFIRNYLIPYFYNETEHETNHYRLYYAPYFD